MRSPQRSSATMLHHYVKERPQTFLDLNTCNGLNRLAIGFGPRLDQLLNLDPDKAIES
jgi:hypothetical protein